MKRFSRLLLISVMFFAPLTSARVFSPGESLWSMQRLVTQASCDVTIRQSDFTAGVYTISTSGVYCLAENITGKIIIDQDSVVLDINGKTITNTADDCIEVNGKSKIIIKRGSVISSNNIGIHIEPGSSQVALENVLIRDCMEGMLIESSSNVYVNACDFIASTTGVILNNASRIIVSNTTASDSIYVGFQLVSSSKNQFLNCSALNTGQGLTDLLTDIYGFFSTDGSSNIFKQCRAQNTLALTVTGSMNVAAGFALSGTESNSQITECISNITETDPDGVATPFGILLQYSFDALVTVTTEAQGALCIPVRWSADGAFLATAGEPQDGDEVQIFKFDRATETLISIAGANQGTIGRALSWFPDGTYLATGGEPEGGDEIQIFSFDPVTGLLTKTDGASHGTSCRSVAWSRDGAYLASGAVISGVFPFDSIKVFSFDRVTGTLTQLSTAEAGSPCQSVDWSPDGAYLAAVGDDNGGGAGKEVQVFAFDRSTGTLTPKAEDDPSAFSNFVQWSPDGAYLAVVGGDLNPVEIWIYSFDRATETIARVDLVDVPGATFAGGLAWSPDGVYLATCDNNTDNVKMWFFDRSTETLTQVDSIAHGSASRSVSWSHDGAYLATGADDGGGAFDEIQVYNALQFPSRNVITNNNVQSVSGPSPLVAGVGISGSSIENMIIGNQSYNNASFNYQFVTNVFDSRFTDEPTLVQNISIKLSPPFYAPQ